MRRTVNPLPKRIRERQVEQGTNPSYNLSDTLTGNGLWSSKLDLIFSNTHEGWAVGRTIQRADGVETERVLVLRRRTKAGIGKIFRTAWARNH